MLLEASFISPPAMGDATGPGFHTILTSVQTSTGDAVTKQMAPEASFTTSPAVGAGSSLRFLAWADSGQATAEDTNEYDYSEDYDPLMTSPAGTTDEAYWADYDVWQIEQVKCRVLSVSRVL